MAVLDLPSVSQGLSVARERRPARLVRDVTIGPEVVPELPRSETASLVRWGAALLILLFGDAGMVEFVGILGYYTLVAMTLNVFRVPLPDDEVYPFAEPRAAMRG